MAIAENERAEPRAAISAIRAISTAPLILFQCRQPHYDEPGFDLVIRVLTKSSQWLSDAERHRNADRAKTHRNVECADVIGWTMPEPLSCQRVEAPVVMTGV